MTRITASVYKISQYGSLLNMYLIKRDEKLILVDTALNAGSIKHVGKYLSKMGLNFENITHILITHAHPDHIGGLSTLQKHTNAPTYVHRLDAPVIEEGQRSGTPASSEGMHLWERIIYQVNSRKEILPTGRVDRVINEDGPLQDLPFIEAIYLPGHSYGQCGFYLPDEGVLICGDTFMHLFGLRFPLRAVSPDWQAVQDSIRKVAALKPEILCFGHGKPIMGNAGDSINTFMRKRMV